MEITSDGRQPPETCRSPAARGGPRMHRARHRSYGTVATLIASGMLVVGCSGGAADQSPATAAAVATAAPTASPTTAPSPSPTPTTRRPRRRNPRPILPRSGPPTSRSPTSSPPRGSRRVDAIAAGGSIHAQGMGRHASGGGRRVRRGDRRAGQGRVPGRPGGRDRARFEPTGSTPGSCSQRSPPTHPSTIGTSSWRRRRRTARSPTGSGRTSGSRPGRRRSRSDAQPQKRRTTS